MDPNQTLLIGAAIAIGFLVVLRWIFTPRRKSRGAPARTPAAEAAAPRTDSAWDGAARRRRDLAT